jgi:hypothetical protein
MLRLSADVGSAAVAETEVAHKARGQGRGVLEVAFAAGGAGILTEHQRLGGATGQAHADAVQAALP